MENEGVTRDENWQKLRYQHNSRCAENQKNTAVGEGCFYMHYEPSEDVKYMAKQPLSFIFFNRIALISSFEAMLTLNLLIFQGA